MATTLLLNPRRRRRSKSKAKRRASPAQRAARAAFAARARARRSNPAPKRRARRRVARRSNPIASYRRSVRRRRNPSGRMSGGLTNLRSYLGPIKDAAVMGVGAVAMDVAYAYVQGYLPAMLRRTPGKVGAGDVAKMLLTVAFGKLLARPTRGLSSKAAMGALVVQMRDIALSFMPATVAAPAAAVNGLAYFSPARVVPGSARVTGGAGYTQAGGRGVGAYVASPSPLLAGVGRFVNANGSPLLARGRGAF